MDQAGIIQLAAGIHIEGPCPVQGHARGDRGNRIPACRYKTLEMECAPIAVGNRGRDGAAVHIEAVLDGLAHAFDGPSAAVIDGDRADRVAVPFAAGGPVSRRAQGAAVVDRQRAVAKGVNSIVLRGLGGDERAAVDGDATARGVSATEHHRAIAVLDDRATSERTGDIQCGSRVHSEDAVVAVDLLGTESRGRGTRHRGRVVETPAPPGAAGEDAAQFAARERDIVDVGVALDHQNTTGVDGVGIDVPIAVVPAVSIHQHRAKRIDGDRAGSGRSTGQDVVDGEHAVGEGIAGWVPCRTAGHGDYTGHRGVGGDLQIGIQRSVEMEL